MDPVQNLKNKNKKVSMDLVHDRGSVEPVQSGGPWTPGQCFVLWIQSNHRIEFSNLSFPIAHLPAGRLTWANSGENFVADPPFSGLMNGGRQNFPPIHSSGMSISSQTNRSSDAMGECCYGFDLSMLMLILQHSVWSWSLWCFYMLFNCYFKECFNAKGRTTKSWHWFFEIVFIWISKIIQDGSTILHALCHVIDVWYNFPRPEHSWL